MKLLCFSKFVLITLLFCMSVFAKDSDKSAALYYGTDISYSNLGLHDYIIVDSDNISPYTPGFKKYKKKLYAYVSIGEASAHRKYFKALKKEWKLGVNTQWNSTVLDISSDDYHSFMYDEVIQPLVDKGYENFFFDTLDSYQLISKSPDERKKYELGLIRFIKKFKVYFPHAKLIVNRGFEVLDEIHEDIDALLFESLFQGLSSKTLTYAPVSKEDRMWLINHVKKAQSYGLDVISVDYVDIKDKAKIKRTIDKIKKLGIIPYIANKEFTRYGDSSKELLKREILVLYSDSLEKEQSNAHLLASLPLEYLGYVPILKTIEEGLPSREELSRYKAVIVWNEKPIKDTFTYESWVKTLLNQKIKVLFLDGFGVSDDTQICNVLGIKKQANKAGILDKQDIIYKDKVFDFETPLNYHSSATLYQISEGKRLLHIMNKYQQEDTAVAVTSWGGYALSGTLTRGFGENTLWIINPFDFFKEALALEDFPIPDPTTENGRRLLFTHIDGDASMNKAEWDPTAYSIGVMYRKILSKYKIPQGVSIVEAETRKDGLYPKDSAKLEEMAKKIYKLPYVEAATHTYTHPFKWTKIINGHLDPKYRLKVKNYDFSIKRELKGSLDYINTNLLPNDKARAKTVYWSGDCLPQEDVLAYAYKQGYVNINGGDTIITNDKPWLSLVAPYGLKRGEYRQVYTGAENENVYTNDWLGPFWGFKKVIQTFELTNKPRRLKPIDIYYHFYAASKTASLTALDEVYAWAVKQNVMPIYASEYIPKVLEFYDTSISKTEEGWNFYGMQALKTLRLSDKSMSVSYNSQNVIGRKDNYLHLNTKVKTLSVKKALPKDTNYLVDTNAKVLHYKRSAKETSFKLQGHVNIILNYHLKKGCTLKTQVKPSFTSTNHAIRSLKLNARESDVFIRCK